MSQTQAQNSYAPYTRPFELLTQFALMGVDFIPVS